MQRLVGQSGQAFQPELAGGGNLVTFFREDNWEEVFRQALVTANFGCNSQQQACLAAAARANDDLVGVRVSRAFAEVFDQ